MKSIYCPKCDALVDAQVFSSMEKVSVRNIELSACQKHAVCPHCGDNIADEEMTRFNLDSAYHAYREKEGLMTPEEIHDAYARYGLTQGSFAKLLELGGATLSRYEHGAVQTKQIDAAIRRAAEPANMLGLLEKNGHLIPADQLEKAQQIAREVIGDSNDNAFAEDFSAGNFRVVLSKGDPSVLNGFRKLDWQRATQMAVYFAEHCVQMGRIKLNKAMFYADYSCFAATTCSMSGLVYARATFGPVIDGFDFMFGEMLREGDLIEEAVDCGVYDMTVLRPAKSFNDALFSTEELAILANVANFVNSFGTASELSEYSHREALWVENENGDKLSYMDAFRLNEPERFCTA